MKKKQKLYINVIERNFNELYDVKKKSGIENVIEKNKNWIKRKLLTNSQLNY